MAIEAMYLNLLNSAISARRKAVGPDIRLRALALAYPDLLVPRASMEQLFGADLVATLPVRDDADKIWGWHGLQGCKEPLYDSLSLFDALGLDVTVIDIVNARGFERIVDLNDPLPPDLVGKFDLVIDTGTCEHCFNVGVAFRNACEAVSLHGFLVHAAPLSRFNHGFWNFSPTVYPDFLGDNAFKIHVLTGVTCDLRNGFKPFQVEPTRRFDAASNAALYVVAERTEIRPMVWPVQRKYRTAAT